MQERFKPYAAALTMLIRDDFILLLRRYNTGWADGYYTLPSGHIDEGESATQAAKRESFEEVGVTIEDSGLSFAHILHRKNDETGKVFVDFFFAASDWQGEPTNMEPDKCDQIQWFKLSALPDNIVPFVADAIAAYRNGIHFSEAGWL